MMKMNKLSVFVVLLALSITATPTMAVFKLAFTCLNPLTWLGGGGAVCYAVPGGGVKKAMNSCTGSVKGMFGKNLPVPCPKDCIKPKECTPDKPETMVPVCLRGKDRLRFDTICSFALWQCRKGQYQLIPEEALFPCPDTKPPCIADETCTEADPPVCAIHAENPSQIYTFEHRCHFEFDNCEKADGQLEIVECPTPEPTVELCPPAETPCHRQEEVCDQNGRIFDNICHLEHYACSMHEHLEERSCPCEQDCSGAIFDPVCGSDGIEYATHCDYENAVCSNNILIDRPLHECQCEVCEVEDNPKPVCGGDGIDYSSECECRRAGCLNDDVTFQCVSGSCSECNPTECDGLEFDPVCDDFGEVYDNECLFKIAQCNDPFIMLGECTGGDSAATSLASTSIGLAVAVVLSTMFLVQRNH